MKIKYKCRAQLVRFNVFGMLDELPTGLKITTAQNLRINDSIVSSRVKIGRLIYDELREINL